MSNSLHENIFEELTSKLRAAGLPEQQVRSFAEQCLGYRGYNPAYFALFENQRMPSDDCFRTLAEAQKIFSSQPNKGKYSQELHCVDRYLKVPYSDVGEAKKEIAGSFGVGDSDVEAVYVQDPEWLLITADSVKAFAAFLNGKFGDPELKWSIYKAAALLGLEKAQYRIDQVLTLLGAETGEKVIRNDLQGEAWLFYRWFTDPVGCIEYMLECGLTPGKVRRLLECETWFLLEYKEGRRRKYNHNQEYIDSVIRKYAE